MKYFIIFLIALTTLNVSQTYANPSGMNAQLGFGWERSEFKSIDPEQTSLFLHYKLNHKSAQSVVIGHDNGGITDNEIEYARYMVSKGFNVFLADRVTARRRVARPNELILIQDSFATTAHIRSHFSGKIDLNNISYVSFSGDGGYGGLMAIEPIVRAKLSEMTGIPSDLFKYKRVVTIYPFCVGLVGRNPDTPTLIIGAELDAHDPIVCKKAYTGFDQVQVDIYKDTPHGFDQLKLRGRQFIKKPYKYPGTCFFTMDVNERNDWDGSRYFLIKTPDGVRQRTKGFGDYVATCENKEYGYWAFYDPHATKKAYEASVDFIKQ